MGLLAVYSPDEYIELIGAEGESRTHTGVTPTVFETAASTVPPLRLEVSL